VTAAQRTTTAAQRIATLLELGCTPQQIKLELAGDAALPQAELGRLICRMAASRAPARGPPPADDGPPPTPIAIRRGRPGAEEFGDMPIPRAFVDRYLHLLGAAELKCYLYIARRTGGFHKQEDAVSIRQFSAGIHAADGRQLDRGTGLSTAQVKRGLAALEALGLIVRTRHRSDRHGHQATSYAIAPLPEGRARGEEAPEPGPAASRPVAHP
jgi:DNA-binding MarR family transcriptional regulator